MSKRTTKKRPLRKFAVGDMRDRPVLHTRSIKSTSGAGFTEVYDNGKKIWASVETISRISGGVATFNGIQLQEATTHIFVTRYRSEATTENVFKWRDNTFDFLKLHNPEERNQYLIIEAKLLGDKSKSANT